MSGLRRLLRLDDKVAAEGAPAREHRRPVDAVGRTGRPVRGRGLARRHPASPRGEDAGDAPRRQAPRPTFRSSGAAPPPRFRRRLSPAGASGRGRAGGAAGAAASSPVATGSPRARSSTEPVPEPAPQLALTTISSRRRGDHPVPGRPPPSAEVGPPSGPTSPRPHRCAARPRRARSAGLSGRGAIAPRRRAGDASPGRAARRPRRPCDRRGVLAAGSRIRGRRARRGEAMALRAGTAPVGLRAP